MAFACRPALIVLDEPTTGLDVSTQRRVLDTDPAACRGYGVAAVYVSHDLAVVSELADEVAVMYAGRIVEAGPAGRAVRRAAAPIYPGAAGRGPGAGQRPAAGRDTRAAAAARPPRPGLRVRRPLRAASWSSAATTSRSCPAVRPRRPAPVRCRCVARPPPRCPRPGRTCRGPGRPRPAAGPPRVLSVRGVSARYRGVPALSGIDLDLPARGCVAVVGESGSGKTTLARCITGLQQDWAGQVTLRGVPLARAARHRPKQVLQQIQYVFQNPYTSLNPRKTVGQIVAEPVQRFLGLPRGEQADRVAQVLEDVALGGSFLARYPDQLSGGERQRVAIARALAAEPDVLICDEVTSALDVSVQAVIVELLRAAAAQRQLAMIFITHNLALVRNVAQTAVVLRQGQIVEAGPAEQILAAPASGYTAQLLADSPRLARDGTQPTPDRQPS